MSPAQSFPPLDYVGHVHLIYLLGCKLLPRRGQTLYCSCLKIARSFCYGSRASLQIHMACVRPASQKLRLQLINFIGTFCRVGAEQRPGLRLGSSPVNTEWDRSLNGAFRKHKKKLDAPQKKSSIALHAKTTAMASLALSPLSFG